MKWAKSSIYLLVLLAFLGGCKTKTTDRPVPGTEVVQPERPEFSADSAYAFIEYQVAMGPRVPGSAAHQECADWLAAKLTAYSAEVVVQKGTVTRYDGKKLPMYNIVGSYNPDQTVRILLCAHWDTRHLADQDTEGRDRPIAGANDGGSGTAVLLEVARQLALKQPEVGVDIVLFDVEDQGQPDGLPYKPDTWCLGSQFWAPTPHTPNYRAKAGILLDMVGAKDALFTLEGISMQYAPQWMRKVWDTAIQLGHSRFFAYERTPAITDDHLYINAIRQIPTIDIIQFDRSTRSGFGPYWHTHDDDMEIISKETLQAVGETVLASVYQFQ